MKIWRHFTRQAKKEYSPRARVAAIACESLFFVFGIPTFLFWLSAVGSEHWRFRSSPAMLVSCLFLGAVGLSLALWTVWTQFHHARGTPVPIMATKKLLTDRPYSFCRNPMALGTLMFYFSIATFTRSFMAVLAVFLFAFFLVAFIKLIEEKEMLMRFGDDYSRYKQNTPFMIPRFPFLGRKSRP